MVRGLRLRGLGVLLVALLTPAAGASEGLPSSWGSAGLLMVRGLPPCLMQDPATARERCLPPPSLDDAEEVRVTRIVDRAVVLIHLMKSGEAAQELEAGIAAHPASLELRHLAARLAVSTFKWSYEPSLIEAAQLHSAAAIALAPNNADVRTTAAYILSAKGQIEDAITAYGMAIALQPNHTVALGQRGFLLSTKKRYTLALKDYEAAIAAAPADRVLRYSRGRLLLEMERPTDALADLDFLIDHNPQESYEIYMMRAGVHQMLGNSGAALEDLTTLLYGPKGGSPFVIGGEHLANTSMRRALVLSDLGRHEEAAKDMSRAIGLGGRQNVLRLQVYLRRNGHSVRLDGNVSPELDAAIQSCFREANCRRGLQEPT